MSHFAHVNNDNTVDDVIVAEQSFIDTLNNASEWVQTSYNTRGGVHYGEDGLPDGLPALRKNFASIGGVYDSVNDAFIPPKPFNSWVLNNQTYLWDAPIPYPNDGTPYMWDETTLTWISIPASIS